MRGLRHSENLHGYQDHNFKAKTCPMQERKSATTKNNTLTTLIIYNKIIFYRVLEDTARYTGQIPPTTEGLSLWLWFFALRPNYLEKKKLFNF